MRSLAFVVLLFSFLCVARSDERPDAGLKAPAKGLSGNCEAEDGRAFTSSEGYRDGSIKRSDSWTDDKVPAGTVKLTWVRGAKTLTFGPSKFTVFAASNDSVTFGSSYADGSSMDAYVYLADLHLQRLIYSSVHWHSSGGQERSGTGKTIRFKCDLHVP